MARIGLNSPDPQIPLALEPAIGPQSETALRSVYLKMQISTRLTFEQVMSDAALAICVRNCARAGAGRASPDESRIRMGRS